MPYERLRNLGISVEHSDELAKKLEVLSKRDQEIFFAWAEGRSYREVGKLFSISYGQVKNIIRGLSSQRGQNYDIYNRDVKRNNRRDRRKDKPEKPVAMKDRSLIYELYENSELRKPIEYAMLRAYGKHKMTLVDNVVDRDDFIQEMWCRLFEDAPSNCDCGCLVNAMQKNAVDYVRKLRQSLVATQEVPA